jgi:ketoreductase RED2
MGMLDGLVAVVSGSTSGIGRAIVERFAAEGAGVVVNSVRSVDEGKALASALPDAAYVRADVSSEPQARSLVAAAMARWGRLDVVVNNAGAAAMVDHRDLDGLTDDMWRRMLDVNLMGTWYLSRAAVPRAQRLGRLHRQHQQPAVTRIALAGGGPPLLGARPGPGSRRPGRQDRA